MFTMSWKTRLQNALLITVLLLVTFHLGETALSPCTGNVNAVISSPCKFSPGIHSYTTLTISTEIFLETNPSSSQHVFNVSQKFDIQAKAVLILDYNRVNGSNHGAGVNGGSGSSGGSYGGRAGAASNTPLSASQSEAYGSAFAVDQPGSWGGGDPSTRGEGGGYLKIYARRLILGGTVRANGGRAQQNDGGGSGGGVSIDCFEIDGNGRVEASGGMGSGKGGGGSGGRISLQFQHGSFEGQALAYGGKTGNANNVEREFSTSAFTDTNEVGQIHFVKILEHFSLRDTDVNPLVLTSHIELIIHRNYYLIDS